MSLRAQLLEATQILALFVEAFPVLFQLAHWLRG